MVAVKGQFEKLPFTEAIDALRTRLAIPKRQFLELAAESRSRAFTAARMTQLEVLEDVHKAVEDAMAEGTGVRDFRFKLARVAEQRGWTGTTPGHANLILRQNMRMAYTAGRLQRAARSGATHWRFLPSTAKKPREEHKPLYGKVFALGDTRYMPPLDFGCKCGWELVWPEELGDVKPVEKVSSADVASGAAGEQARAMARNMEGQEFQFDAAAYASVVEPDPRPAFPRAITGEAVFTAGDFGRPAVKDVPAAQRRPLPARLPKPPRSMPDDQARELVEGQVRTALGIAPGETLRIKDPTGATAVLGDRLINHLLEHSARGPRFEAAGAIPDVIRDPWEIWLTPAIAGNRRTYVKKFLALYDDPKLGQQFVMLERDPNGAFIGVTSFPSRRTNYIEKQRVGVLLYARS